MRTFAWHRVLIECVTERSYKLNLSSSLSLWALLRLQWCLNNLARFRRHLHQRFLTRFLTRISISRTIIQMGNPKLIKRAFLSTVTCSEFNSLKIRNNYREKYIPSQSFNKRAKVFIFTPILQIQIHISIKSNNMNCQLKENLPKAKLKTNKFVINDWIP